MEYIASRVIFGIWLSGGLPKRVSWDVKCLCRVIFGVFLNLLASSWSLPVLRTLVHPGSNIAYVIRSKLHFGSSPISADTSASHKQSPIDAVHRSQQKMAQVFSNIFGGAKPSPPPVSSGDSGKLPCGHLNRGRTNQTPPQISRILQKLQIHLQFPSQPFQTRQVLLELDHLLLVHALYRTPNGTMSTNVIP